jgi:hypothetical protein
MTSKVLSRPRRCLSQCLALGLLTAGVASLRGGSVIINELMYHPASHLAREEYLELFNRGTNAFNLAEWKLTAGVRFTFPPVVLWPGGYVVVAADLATFTNLYPSVTNVLGPWVGRLSSHGETITLENAFGEEEDSVTFATEGDWSERRRGPDDHGHRGWVWASGHDGGGKSLELINPAQPSRYGQNWAASITPGGTPGQPNSTARTNLAPFILDVSHFPLVPRSTNAVTITARLLDESPLGVTASVSYRLDGAAEFIVTPMADDGRHGDGAPGDRLFGAILPAQTNGAVVEFYVTAADAGGLTRTWPAPVQPEGAQSANCLYQVSDSTYAGTQPLYRLLTTEAERQELAAIGALPWYWSSDAEMNGTFISDEAGHTELRYVVGIRLRGSTSREYAVKNRRVHFSDDQTWHRKRAIVLNALNPHSQVIGSVICRLAGLPGTEARLVQVRENDQQLATSNGPPFGAYAELEALDSVYAGRQFPDDSSGNLYHPLGDGNLDYLGEDQAAYSAPGFYVKDTNLREADWSDVVRLTRALNTTAPETYGSAVRQVAVVDEWVRYFALNTLLGNMETSLGQGGAGDYTLYFGVEDPRARLMMYDLDSLLGVFGGVDAPLFRATNNPAVGRFLTSPDFAPLYYSDLLRLMETTLAPQNFNAVLDQTLGGDVPAPALQAMKDFLVARAAFVRGHIPQALGLSTNLPVLNTYWVTTQPRLSLRGSAGVVQTRRVLVNGLEAAWQPVDGTWEVKDVPLLPGVNPVLVQALDSAGAAVQSQIVDVRFETGSSNAVGGTLTSDTTLSVAGGPHWVLEDLEVPVGVTLTIEPGATVYFRWGKQMRVFGRLVAEGTPERRIRLTRPPDEIYVYNLWNGIGFSDSTNDNRLRYVDMGYNTRKALALTNSTLLVEHATWFQTFQNIIWTQNSSLIVRDSIFPTIAWNEHVEGIDMPPEGHVIFERNIFGSTIGYQDIIDFSGGHRPGPIFQALDNVFLGGSDDGLDLDGTDAHIEGNVFMHFHKNNDSTSESSAIATGEYHGEHTQITVVRNIFYDNDYDIVLKEGAFLTSQNNTYVASQFGSLAFAEPQRPREAPPAGVRLEGDIFWNHPAVIANLDPALLASGTVEITALRSILPQAGPWSREGVLSANPLFEDATNDFHLRPGSPALGTGPNGLDMGAYVPGGVSLAGGPPQLTWLTSAAFTVGGPGITHYKFRLNDGSFSPEAPISTPIRLVGLANGTYSLAAVGKNSAGVWQAESNACTRSWTVNTGLARLLLNEVLAHNDSLPAAAGYLPDLVELYNQSGTAADLTDLSLTDDPANPRKFVFRAGVVVGAGGYLTLFADNRTEVAGLHLGFGLKETGDALYLYDRPERGGELLDSVQFGLQVPDLSIGRVPEGGAWTLTHPTFGAANRAHPLGDPRALKINEWLASSDALHPDDFIELYNPGPLPVPLAGLFLSDEPIEAPRQHALPGLGFLGARAFRAFLADGEVRKGPVHLGFKLNSRGGLIGLQDADGTAIDRIAYGQQWPGASQGRTPSGGRAIVSFAVPTPGAAAASATDPRLIVLNEVMADNRSRTNALGASPDWVELFNRGAVTIDLAGLGLSDNLGNPHRWVFPPGSLIPAGGYWVVYCDASAAASATNTGFGLAASGDAVYLFDRLENNTALLDSVVFGPQAADYSIGRIPDATGDWRLTLPSLAGPNAEAPLGGVAGLRINEWMANPASGEDWFELFNPSALPVALGGLKLTDDLTDLGLSTIPPLSFIGGGAYGYQQFIADGNETGRDNHVGFKLASGGEAIGLATSDGFLIDRVIFGTQLKGVSEGRYPDGGDAIVSFPRSNSPGRANTFNSAPVLVAVPDQSVAVGQTLRLRLAASDADQPAQTLAFGFAGAVPSGMTLESRSGLLSWTPTDLQGPALVAVLVTVTDSGSPPLSASQLFHVRVVGGALDLRLTAALAQGAEVLALTWNAQPGHAYSIESTDTLTAPQWTTLGQVTTTDTTGAFTTPANTRLQQYYRLRLIP